MKYTLKRFLPPIIMLVGGIIFIYMGFKNMSDLKKFKTVEAVVTKIDYQPAAEVDEPDTEIIYVKYSVNGTTYNEILQYAEGSYKEGQSVTVYYNPKKPSYVMKASMTSSLVRIAFGGLMLIGCIGSILMPRRFI